MKLKKIIFIMVFLSVTISIFTPVAAESEWVQWYSETSFTLNQGYHWRLSMGGLKGYNTYIQVSVNGIIDIYVTDEENMNKFWSSQTFTSYLTYEGVSAKTINYTLPSDQVWYLLIDNTNIYGTPSSSDVSGAITIHYLSTTSAPFDPIPILILILAIGICLAIIIPLVIYEQSKKKKKSKQIEKLESEPPSNSKEKETIIKERIKVIYDLPEKCPNCNAPLKYENVKMRGLNKAECGYCNSMFDLIEKEI